MTNYVTHVYSWDVRNSITIILLYQWKRLLFLSWELVAKLCMT